VEDLGATALRLGAFLTVLLLVGMYVVPRLIQRVARLNRPETTLLVSVGVCFAIVLATEGFTTAAGLALRLDTMELSDYRLDFEARIRSRAVGWVVRAADTSNYYAFKLVENGSQGPYLIRYPVIGGSRRGGSPVRVELPAKLATPEFNRITVHVRGEQITTLVNGWGVDFWKDGAIPAGGVGFLSENGETALVRKLTVTGNADTWGLILYGTLETLRTLEEHFGSGPVAFQLQPFPPGLLAANRR
jgi:hypothetical protein